MPLRPPVTMTYLAFFRIALLILASATAPVALAEDRAVQFDFGSPELTTDGPWNNVTAPDGEGVLVAGAIDQNGIKTSVRLIQVDGWAGFNARGVKQAERFPTSVSQDSFYLQKEIDTRARMILDGLNAGEPYFLSLAASRADSQRPSEARITVQQTQLTLDVAKNACEAISPDTPIYANDLGQIIVTVECPADQTYSYFGYLKLKGKIKNWEENLLPEEAAGSPPEVTAKAWALANAATGEILAGKNNDVVRPMASMTKVMTALIILELAVTNPEILNETVIISAAADETPGSTAGVRAGERVSVNDLLYGLLLPSGNDAAVALAEHFGGRFPLTATNSKTTTPIDQFIAEMNRRAQELGMSTARYFDPHGNSANFAAPVDLIRLGVAFMKNPLAESYVSTRIHHAEAHGPDGKTRSMTWRNTNQLLERSGYHGIKTGTTGRAGECLLACGTHQEQTYLLVVMGASRGTRFVDARNLFRWGFSHFTPNGTEDAATQ